jgi:hypothetical protein
MDLGERGLRDNTRSLQDPESIAPLNAMMLFRISRKDQPAIINCVFPAPAGPLKEIRKSFEPRTSGDCVLLNSTFAGAAPCWRAPATRPPWAYPVQSL